MISEISIQGIEGNLYEFEIRETEEEWIYEIVFNFSSSFKNNPVLNLTFDTNLLSSICELEFSPKSL